MKDGAVVENDVMNIFARKPTGWRLLLNMPGAEVKRTVMP